MLAFGKGNAAAPTWRARRDLYPQGVASGGPAPDSVLLWTRRQPAGGDPRAAYLLTVGVSKNKELHDAALVPMVIEGDAQYSI